MRARHALSRTGKALQLERKGGHHFVSGRAVGAVSRPSCTAPTARSQKKWCPHSSKLQRFHVFHRGCIAQVSLNDREESELKLIPFLLCPLGSCQRDTLYQKQGRLCDLKEGGQHSFSGRAAGAATWPSCTAPTARSQMKWCPHSSKLQSLLSFS